MRKFLLPVACLVFGFAAGSLRAKKPVQQLPFDEPIAVMHCINPGDGSAQFVPYATRIDDKSVTFGAPPADDAQAFRIEFAGGRAVVFATKKPCGSQ